MMNKYRNKSCVILGNKFASQAEGRRYTELLMLVQSKFIKDLVLQPRFRIEVNSIKICDYVADFRYSELVDGQLIDRIEDVKGILTPVYKLKKKLLKAVHGLDIIEIK